VASDRVEDQVQAALMAASDEEIDPSERAEMLMEIAIGLQTRPKSGRQLEAAAELYDKALALCPSAERLLRARITARKGTALQAIMEEGTASLECARDAYREAISILADLGMPEEVAEAEMNLGLVLQNLASANRARITDAISAYQRALRTFERERFPKEFAILQNNLAIAFLSMPFTDEHSKMREALAVQAFEEGLRVVNLIDHPVEYAMLQNNLGNALQYASSSHAVENNLRALDAYDAALRVRLRATMPMEYANTITNKANCLWNLADDPEHPEHGNGDNLLQARILYAEAREIFVAGGDTGKARIVAEALFQIGREMMAQPVANGSGHVSREAGSSLDG
jgi:tetratricopeptide (TPR) repeat protein